MITHVTIACDWPDCPASLVMTIDEFLYLVHRPNLWKVEPHPFDGLHAYHLCPDHVWKKWEDVREFKRKAGAQAHSTHGGWKDPAAGSSP